MSYRVKEIFYTFQGEGANAGTPAVFCRFAGCNLWSGREEDRETAQCQFCDTDFVGTDGTLGGKYLIAAELATQIAALWPSIDTKNRFVVFTGGEPLLQIDDTLIDAMHEQGFRIAVETNCTLSAVADASQYSNNLPLPKVPSLMLLIRLSARLRRRAVNVFMAIRIELKLACEAYPIRKLAW
jgi:7-carboxy-7-deazaguanine synthase (Cx14CxxC type)